MAQALAQASTQLQFGIVGAGMIAEFHAKAIAAMDDARLAAVFARRPEQAQQFGSKHGCAAYDDYAAFLQHDGLDVVTICSPSGAHLEPTLADAQAVFAFRNDTLTPQGLADLAITQVGASAFGGDQRSL